MTVTLEMQLDFFVSSDSYNKFTKKGFCDFNVW